jgi:hypothetical protein
MIFGTWLLGTRPQLTGCRSSNMNRGAWILFSFLVGLVSSVRALPPCRELLKTLASEVTAKRDISQIYSELQKPDEHGKTRLALQSDYDSQIKPEGGGACFSATAFNALQGLRVLSEQPPLLPHEVLNEAFRAVPKLLDGRVTNTQMAQLIHHFQKFFPKHSLEFTSESSPQSKPAEGEPPGKPWTRLEDTKFVSEPDGVKMLVYQVHNADGKLLGRHCVVLKRFEEGHRIVVIDPNFPAKELSYQYTEEKLSGEEAHSTRIERADGIPHKLGWVFTLDSIFSVKLRAR